MFIFSVCSTFPVNINTYTKNSQNSTFLPKNQFRISFFTSTSKGKYCRGSVEVKRVPLQVTKYFHLAGFSRPSCWFLHWHLWPNFLGHPVESRIDACSRSTVSNTCFPLLEKQKKNIKKSPGQVAWTSRLDKPPGQVTWTSHVDIHP